MNLKHFERGILLIVAAVLNIFVGRWIDGALIFLGIIFLFFAFIESQQKKEAPPSP